MKYQELTRKRVFQGFFAVDEVQVTFERFAGGMMPAQTREVFERGSAAAVLPYDPVRDEIVWIEQFRAAAISAGENPWMMEPVAGIFDRDESAEALVRREAIEEAGCVISDLQPITTYLASPGGSSEKVLLFCGRTDSTQAGGIYGLEEEGEDIKVHVCSYAQSVRWLEEGKLSSALSLITMQWLMLNREKLREQWAA